MPAAAHTTSTTTTATTQPAPAAGDAALTRNSMLVAACVGASRVLGFARDTALGALFGDSPTAESLRLAFNIPNFLRRLLGEGAFTGVFLPMFHRARARGGDPEARELVAVVGGAQLAILVALALAGCGICAFFPPSVLAGWLSKDPERAPLLLRYLTILIPYLVPVCLYAFLTAILNAKNRFFVPAIAPFVQNCVAILAFIAAWGIAGGFRNPQLLSADELDLAARIVAFGFLAGGIAMVAMQLPALRREGMLVMPKAKIHDPAFREFLQKLLPLALSMGVVQVSVFLSSVIAFSVVAGGANVHLDYAARIFQLPQGVVGFAVATAAFPELARYWAAGRYADARAELDRGLGLATFLGAPAAAGLLALADPIVTVLFGYGKFGPDACHKTARTLEMFAISIPFLTSVPLLARVFYAAGNTKTPSVVSACLVVFDIGGALVLAKTWGVAGIALATTVTAILNCVILGYLLHRFPLPRNPRLLAHLAKILFVALACGAAAYGARQLCDAWFAGRGRAFLALEVGLSIAAGVAAVVAAARLLRIPELGDIVRVLGRRRSGGHP
jgi:putative peptidoglycan lipid II flippase